MQIIFHEFFKSGRYNKAYPIRQGVTANTLSDLVGRPQVILIGLNKRV